MLGLGGEGEKEQGATLVNPGHENVFFVDTIGTWTTGFYLVKQTTWGKQHSHHQNLFKILLVLFLFRFGWANWAETMKLLIINECAALLPAAEPRCRWWWRGDKNKFPTWYFLRQFIKCLHFANSKYLAWVWCYKEEVMCENTSQTGRRTDSNKCTALPQECHWITQITTWIYRIHSQFHMC